MYLVLASSVKNYADTIGKPCTTVCLELLVTGLLVGTLTLGYAQPAPDRDRILNDAVATFRLLTQMRRVYQANCVDATPRTTVLKSHCGTLGTMLGQLQPESTRLCDMGNIPPTKVDDQTMCPR